jgi:transcriptional regulator with XRE-family HTH domain
MFVFSKNIKVLRVKQGLSQEQLADLLGVTRSRIGSYEEGRSEPNLETLIKIASFFKLPIDALVKTDLSRSGNKSFIEIGKNRVLFPVMIDEQNNETIEIVSMKASAGYLNGYADPEYIESLQRMKLPFVPTGKHRAFPIKGDSMPPLGDGSFVVGRFVEDLRDIRNGQTYVLLTQNDGIVYKRVFNKLKEKKRLLLCSDNKLYDPYEVHAEEVLEAWEFVCSIHTKAHTEDELNLQSIMNMLRELRVELQMLKQPKK